MAREAHKPRLESMQGSISVEVISEGSKDQYLVKGEDSEGLFEVIRRTKDFELARKLLLTQWPGVFLPSIKGLSCPSPAPEISQEAAERKRAIFQSFLTHLMRIPSLYHCRTVRLFLFTGPNYDKSIGNATSPSIQSITEDYLCSFPSFIPETEIDYSAELEKQRNLLKTALIQTGNMRKLGKELNCLFSNYLESSERLNSCFENYESEVISECSSEKSGNYRPVFKRIERKESENPYLEVVIRAQQGEWQLEAMLEAIQAFTFLKSELERLESLRFSTSKDLEKLQTGGFTLTSLLSFQSKSASVLELEADIRWVQAT